MATQSILESGLQTTMMFSPMVSRLSCDLLWEMMGTHGLAYQMMMESLVILAIRIRSLKVNIDIELLFIIPSCSYLFAAILTGAAGLIWGMASSLGQPTG